MKYSFRNDYSEVGHPEILKVLLDNAYTQNVGYGFDDVTNNLEKLVSNICGNDVNIVLLSGGTQANLVVISKILSAYEAVIAVDSGHINVHETGAVEGTGHKVLTVPAINGKITPCDIEKLVALHTDCHMVLPKMVYISNSTEVGTVYTKEELENIYKTCKENNLYLFIDGARISQALYASNMTLKDVVDNCDVCYFGGTKNGLPYGEMIIIKDKGIAENFHYHLKNRGAMLAKTYVLSMMFAKLLTDDLYLELGKNAVEKCNVLKQGLLDLGVEVCYPNNTNQLFIKLDNKVVDVLSNVYAFEVWENLVDAKVIRLVTSWATSEEKVLEFLKDIKEIIK